MKYYGGCDVGSTYTKAVILDENGKIVADTTLKSKINPTESAQLAMDEVLKQAGLSTIKDLAYLIGTGYGRNEVPFAEENISEISCHAMGVHVTDPPSKPSSTLAVRMSRALPLTQMAPLRTLP